MADPELFFPIWVILVGVQLGVSSVLKTILNFAAFGADSQGWGPAAFPPVAQTSPTPRPPSQSSQHLSAAPGPPLSNDSDSLI